jgi:hypothetical protein
LHHCKHIILKVATAYLKVTKNLKIPAILTLTNLFRIKYLFKKLLNIDNAKRAFLKFPIDAYHGWSVETRVQRVRGSAKFW